MFTYYNHYGSVTRNANVVCPRDARAIEVLRGETHFSVLGSKARAGELTGGTPVRCFVIYFEILTISVLFLRRPFWVKP